MKNTNNWWDEPTTTKNKMHWWDDPSDEELEKEYLLSLTERCSSYKAFAGSYD